MLVKVPMVPRRIRTVARFEAADPWNGGVRCGFSIESYALVPARITAPEAWPLYAKGARLLQGIRSELDGAERLLPASLVDLWKRGEASAESLPGLLQALEDDVREADCQPPSLVPALPGAAVSLLAAGVGLALAPGALARKQGGLLIASGFAVVLGLTFAAVLLFVVLPREVRRKRQAGRARSILAGAAA